MNKVLGALIAVSVTAQGLTPNEARIALPKTLSGSWVAHTNGEVCRTGRIENSNKLTLPKISHNDEITIVVTPDEGREIRRVLNPQITLSPIKRKSSGAVIYQLPVRTYFAGGKGRKVTGNLSVFTKPYLTYLKEVGVDYLWLTGIVEQASHRNSDPDVVKGEAGSYYAIRDSWDINPDLGGFAELRQVIAWAHEAEIGVLMDFVVNHTARNHKTDVLCKEPIDFGANDQTTKRFHPQNSYYYLPGEAFIPPEDRNNRYRDGIYDYDILTPGLQQELPAKMTGNDIASSRPRAHDWYETAKLNYGYNFETKTKHFDPRPRTWDIQLDVAKFWLTMGIDGFRIDFAHAVPLAFWEYFVKGVREVHPEAFLIAEAYESDTRMAVAPFSYEKLLETGIDAIYNSEMYWQLHNRSARNDYRGRAEFLASPAGKLGSLGHRFINYMENHDEVRLAHPLGWFDKTTDWQQRSKQGLALTAYSGFLPGHLLIHGGQEVGEQAEAYGDYTGDNGKTSIFDYVHQPRLLRWLLGQGTDEQKELFAGYYRLLNLKHDDAMAEGSYLPVGLINERKPYGRVIKSYGRSHRGTSYLVVSNTGASEVSDVTIHLTAISGRDSHGILTMLGIFPNTNDVTFEETFAREGWKPRDPNLPGPGIPGSVLYRSAGVPSGLFLGTMPAFTTYVFKISR